jgi:hypothetical protein
MSGSELGFGDARDTALLLRGSAGTFALVLAAIDVVVRELWQRLRALA